MDTITGRKLHLFSIVSSVKMNQIKFLQFQFHAFQLHTKKIKKKEQKSVMHGAKSDLKV